MAGVRDWADRDKQDVTELCSVFPVAHNSMDAIISDIITEWLQRA